MGLSLSASGDVERLTLMELSWWTCWKGRRGGEQRERNLTNVLIFEAWQTKKSASYCCQCFDTVVLEGFLLMGLAKPGVTVYKTAS